ncbi:MAG: cytochrome b/b6 domain-containing protein [Acidimicrobiales bacterium]
MVQRYNRLTRWLHTGTYVLTLFLLFTGWWLWRGEEGNASIVAQWLDLSDIEAHKSAGWALGGLLAVGIVLGIRGTVTFVRETFRANRGDSRWFLRWPVGALTGRFAPHRGHFDPGQRILNVAMAGSLGTVIVSGIVLTQLKGGSTFALVTRTHRYASYVLAPLVLGHILVAAGILPGYRGAWRGMHLRGRVRDETVRRLWPATLDEPAPEDGGHLPPSEAGSPGGDHTKNGARV